jgi:CRP/FNR family transcriptional regulator, cyclic AMP receptor protein
MVPQQFPAGTTIFAEGDPSDRAYLVRSGRVEIVKRTPNGRLRLAVLGEGDVLGEMGLLDERPRSATAIAVETVVADAVTQSEFTRLLLHEPRRVIALLRALFERVRTVNEMLTEHAAPREDPPAMPHVTLLPLTPETRAAVPAEGITITRFPFKVGRRPDSPDTEVLAFNDLGLADRAPHVLSLNHFALDLRADGLIVRDRGSQRGTVVNGTRIGALAARDTAPLRPGENEVVAGHPRFQGAESPFRFRVVVASRTS